MIKYKLKWFREILIPKWTKKKKQKWIIDTQCDVHSNKFSFFVLIFFLFDWLESIVYIYHNLKNNLIKKSMNNLLNGSIRWKDLNKSTFLFEQRLSTFMSCLFSCLEFTVSNAEYTRDLHEHGQYRFIIHSLNGNNLAWKNYYTWKMQALKCDRVLKWMAMGI